MFLNHVSVLTVFPASSIAIIRCQLIPVAAFVCILDAVHDLHDFQCMKQLGSLAGFKIQKSEKLAL